LLTHARSPPQIGAGINQKCREGSAIAVSDPVGLYIYDFKTSNFRLDVGDADDDSPDPQDLIDIPSPERVFRFVRGDVSKNQGLRLHIEIPDDIRGPDNKKLSVSNIYDIQNNTHIRYGAQFADYIHIGLKAAIKPAKAAQPIKCIGKSAPEAECKCEPVPVALLAGTAAHVGAPGLAGRRR
jgi:hypothetical protein